MNHSRLGVLDRPVKPGDDSECVARACSANLVIASAAKQSRIFPRWDSGLLRCARNDGVEQSAYRQDNPASIVVQKPQWSGARIGAPAWASNRWASNRKTATVKTIRAEENRTKRLRMGLRLIDIVVE